MRPHRAQVALRNHHLLTSHSVSSPCYRPSTTCLASGPQTRHASTLPPSSHFAISSSRFRRYQQQPAADVEIEDLRVRNPLNYVDAEAIRSKRNQHFRNKMIFNGCGAVAGLLFQAWLIFTFMDWDAYAEGKKQMADGSWSWFGSNKTGGKVSPDGAHRLDAPPGAPSGTNEKGEPLPVKIVQDKPGDPTKKIDEDGNELIETGTSTIPHFPRTIKVPSASAQPSAQPTSDTPGEGAQTGHEEYALLGLGIRTVSFLRIQVYVLGLYVRTSDLDKLQAAFVRHVNPLGSSLIPSEKEALRHDLMSEDKSLEIWDKVLKETPVRSAVRIVPTRSTDFAHLRDGWVTGITGRTREASQISEGRSEWDEPGFGESMGGMKALLTGKGNAPKGSMVLLTRDEQGQMQVMYEPEKKVDSEGVIVERGAGRVLGLLEDERISRQIWMGYLGGKGVSSEGARRSIVDGVMELVERPVGTVGNMVV